MAASICKNSRATCSCVLCVLLLCGGTILFVSGGIQHSIEYPKVLFYKDANCTIRNIFYIHLSCPMNSITSTCRKTLLEVMFYDGKSLVTANIDDAKEHYESESVYQCWYDTRNTSIVQLNEPSIRIAIILLNCGGGLMLLGLICACLRWHFIKKKRNAQSENYFTVLFALT